MSVAQRAGQGRLRGAEDGDGRCADTGSEMHGAGVIREQEVATAQRVDQLGECGLADEIGARNARCGEDGVRDRAILANADEFPFAARRLLHGADHFGEAPCFLQDEAFAVAAATRDGNMTGSRYRVEGEITSIVKQTKNVKDVFYNFHLSLINNETGVLEWEDEKEIRKTASR